MMGLIPSVVVDMLKLVTIETSDNFQELFNPSKDRKNLFRG